MMKEYIEKELLKERFLKWLPPDGDWDYQSMGLHPIENIAVSAIMEIEEAPAADVKEVVHAKWKRKYNVDRGTYWHECSNCGCRPPRNQWGQEYDSDYCPDCGATMDKVIKEKF